MEQYPRKLLDLQLSPQETRNIDLDDALNKAITEGRMTLEDAEECRNEYFRRLRGLPNPAEHPDSTTAA